MTEYRWDPKATERGEDKPLKENDHSVDALRYVVATTETNWRHLIDTSRPELAAA
jgi:phage terminase large subunit